MTGPCCPTPKFLGGLISITASLGGVVGEKEQLASPNAARIASRTYVFTGLDSVDLEKVDLERQGPPWQAPAWLGFRPALQPVPRLGTGHAL
jgi:hypothetical protein